jgi:alkylation response protein AidB-like acyl-CoA dehydrogenase
MGTQLHSWRPCWRHGTPTGGAIRYARERRQFGKAIGKFQSVANRIADMKVRLETARLLLYKVAWLKKMGKPAVMEAAMAKLYLSECFVLPVLDAIRTYGGYGYMTELKWSVTCVTRLVGPFTPAHPISSA